MTWLWFAIVGIRLRLHILGACIPLLPTPHANTDPSPSPLICGLDRQGGGERRGASLERRTEQMIDLAIPLAHESSFAIRPQTPTQRRNASESSMLSVDSTQTRRSLHSHRTPLLCWHGFRGPRTRVPALSCGPCIS